MNEEKAIGFVAFLLLFTFLVFLFPQVANNAFASSTTSYAKPVMIAMISVLVVSLVYFAAKKVGV